MRKQLDTNEFKMTMTLAKAYTGGEGSSSMFISGLASGTQVDHHDDMMATSAIDSFKKAIEEGTVLPNGEWSQIPLRSGHRTEWNDILGWITKAEIDSDYNLWVEAELDQDSSDARDLFKKLTSTRPNGRPLQLGLSVGGKIREATEMWNADLQKKVRVINGVVLNEISVVGAPAYPPSYLEALTKSVVWEEDNKESLMEDEVKGTDATQQVSEEITKNNDQEVVAETTALEKSSDDLREMVENLAKSVSDLTTSVATLLAKDATVEETKTEVVEKSAEKEETVEKTESLAPSLDDITKALDTKITSVFDTFAKDVLSKVEAISTKVDELAEMPMDKSVSLARGKTATALSAEEQLRELAKSQENRFFDPIAEALKIGASRNDNS